MSSAVRVRSVHGQLKAKELPCKLGGAGRVPYRAGVTLVNSLVFSEAVELPSKRKASGIVSSLELSFD